MPDKARRGTRGRERSASPLWDGNKYPPEYYIASIEASEVEDRRYQRLTLEERRAEDGARLQRQLNDDPTLLLILRRHLQTIRSETSCDASHCLFDRGGKRHRKTTVGYRVLFGAESDDLYHVQCLEMMINLSSLAPSRFKLDTKTYRWNENAPYKWGFMFLKWFELGGRVDLNKIANYFGELDAYNEENDNWNAQHIDWRPSRPKPPEHKDYTTDDGRACPLSAVLNHVDRKRI